MKKYMITLNDKVYEVEIEEVIKSTGKEKAKIIQNSNVTSIDVNEGDSVDAGQSNIHID
ncbi:hypothetical protein [Clostridium psychrophilum]|uniref:hypothetical protein n=1 Tax=Clostridium psychrophilum TaxID=132926 RepID=UPI001C0CED35|nr:hypothetical protein [Clostridium psychrophilum]MBU3182140.1 hypothetical protein [Clostridium psychrophilum]